ncbi:MAG: ATP-binding protein [Ilumatobacteraceae bacterium]|nr:ATP-binding protein [Ilumatobacteraceae bacterium]
MSDFEVIQDMMVANAFEPFIRSIEFPRFKNLEPGTRIDFDSPITALIGPNGTNKSSILRAIQACPQQYDIGDYWFDTPLDPVGADSQLGTHRYIHRYQLPSGSMAEVIKARVGTASRGPDYFETSAPRIRDGMANMPDLTPASDERFRSKTRWSPIEKPVTYLDFRQELPAYDIFYFFDLGVGAKSASDKKQRIRRTSGHIRSAIQNRRTSFKWYGNERIIEPAQDLGHDELDDLRSILGRKYTSVSMIKHSFFGVPGFTARLHTGHSTYSEAYAGSGEFAATMITRALHSAPSNSLILLDEPETSLHPGAQSQLMRVVARLTKERKLQVVLATHSEHIVRELPDNARKLLDTRPDTGVVYVAAQRASVSESFVRLGSAHDKIQILVEDQLATAVVERAARLIGPAALGALRVDPVPGGAGNLTSRVIPVQAAIGSSSMVLLDGDQKPQRSDGVVDATEDELFAWESNPGRPTNAMTEEEVDAELTTRFGINPSLIVSDGGNDPNAAGRAVVQKRVTLGWARTHVFFLPGTSNPEALLCGFIGADLGSTSPKEYWRALATEELGLLDSEEVSAPQILHSQKAALAKVTEQSPVMGDLVTLLRRLLGTAAANP